MKYQVIYKSFFARSMFNNTRGLTFTTPSRLLKHLSNVNYTSELSKQIKFDNRQQYGHTTKCMRYVTFRSDNVFWHSPGAAMTNDMRAPTFETSSCLSEHAWQSANYTSGLLSCFSVQKRPILFCGELGCKFLSESITSCYR